MKISVILVSYNSWDDTRDCLNSLKHVSTTHTLEVIVVDNFSSEPLPFSIDSYKQQFSLVTMRTDDNLGFSGGNNVGIQQALAGGADYIVLLNNDTVVDPGFLDVLVKTSVELNNTAVLTPKIYFARGYEFHADRYKKSELGSVFWYAGGTIDWANVYASHVGVDEVDTGQYNTRCETEFISGCCMFIPAAIARSVGMLDDAYFLYYEDVDWCMRAKAQGHALMYEPTSVIWHKNAQSSGKSGSDIHVYYQTRNRLIFGMRYASLRTKFALFRESMRLIQQGGIQAEAIQDYYTRQWGKKK